MSGALPGGSPDDSHVLRWGVAGLGRAFTLMLPTFVRDPRVRLVAAADPRPEARERFVAELGARAHASVDALCRDADVDVIYVATPHGLHAEHAVLAARNGKHVLVEKPMALSVGDCTRMIEAAHAAGVQLCVGHSHSYDAPVRRTRDIIDSGAFGSVRMIQALYYTDFLYRPRRPEELDTARGGGAVWNQAAHQVDIARLLGGGRVAHVRALTGNWDPARNTEGAYAALLAFEGGAFASLTYNGYGLFDSDEFCGWTSELGMSKEASGHGTARRGLRDLGDPAAELSLKQARNYGGPAYRSSDAPRTHEHFGTFIVSCDGADLRPMPDGVMVYEGRGARFEALPPPSIPRREVIDEVHRAIATGTPPLHDGRWARATLEVCAAMLESARTGRDVPLVHQLDAPKGAACE
ncbi:MAG TPA: Gfo/Idh/MocA family oxidoreductase [Casimicrobiaceae bacterium]|nr:Gfo/Idh/MocA family oxidoreductase [Casimicrobiaceae bacterium]